MSEVEPIPVVLEKGEKEVRRVEGVKLEGKDIIGRGFLLLTDRKLIFNGKLLAGEASMTTAFEWSLDDVLGCETKSPLFGKKKLLVIFRQGVMKIRQVTGEIFTHTFKPKIRERKSIPVYAFTDINQPEVLRSEIMEQIERYKKSQPPKVEKCLSCGVEIPAGAVFCPSCGRRVE